MKKFWKKKIAIYRNRRENSEEYFFSPNFFIRTFNKNLKITYSYIHAINFIEMYKKKLLSENILNELKLLIYKKKSRRKMLKIQSPTL